MEHLEWHGISRERFLKGAGAALGAAVLGGGYASRAQAETVADPLL